MTQRKEMAPESAQTRKVREKLEKKMQKIENQVTPEALRKKVEEMHKWIAKNAKDREVLRSKTISLFDENQNTARVSKKISGLVEQLQKEMQIAYEEQGPGDLLKKMIASGQNLSLSVEKK